MYKYIWYIEKHPDLYYSIMGFAPAYAMIYYILLPAYITVKKHHRSL